MIEKEKLKGIRAVDCLYIVIPAYNEEENIKEVVRDWYSVIEAHNGSDTSRLVIIDDGSRDRTWEILLECSKERPLLTPLHRENKGHGATLYEGYEYALNQGADYIFQTDSDRQTLPDEFEQFWEKRGKYQALIGYRNHRKDGGFRILTAKVLRILLFMIFRVRVTDANTPYRLMDSKSLGEELAFVPSGFNLCNVLLSVLYVKHKRKCEFLPITFQPRIKGKNSINPVRIMRIGVKAVGDFVKLAGKI